MVIKDALTCGSSTFHTLGKTATATICATNEFHFKHETLSGVGSSCLEVAFPRLWEAVVDECSFAAAGTT